MVSVWLLALPLCAFTIAMAISGALIIAVPQIAATSPTLTFVPRWTTTAWGISLLLGGAMATFGLLRCRPDFESSGLVILASAQFFAATTSYFALGFVGSILGVLLRDGLAVALLLRAYLLVREGRP